MAKGWGPFVTCLILENTTSVFVAQTLVVISDGGTWGHVMWRRTLLAGGALLRLMPIGGASGHIVEQCAHFCLAILRAPVHPAVQPYLVANEKLRRVTGPLHGPVTHEPGLAVGKLRDVRGSRRGRLPVKAVHAFGPTLAWYAQLDENVAGRWVAQRGVRDRWPPLTVKNVLPRKFRENRLPNSG